MAGIGRVACTVSPDGKKPRSICQTLAVDQCLALALLSASFEDKAGVE